VQIVVEHYRAMVQPLLGGKAKAMVVVGSRKEAVRWKLAIDGTSAPRAMRWARWSPFRRGERPEKRPRPASPRPARPLNPASRARHPRDLCKARYHILLVANKFQTGFDQPLLCGMYVDRRLAAFRRCRPCRA
jgi:type I restriction enzyme, R subunit